MSEYIDRNELLKTINENVAEAHNERCSQLLEAILNASPADVVEVRHGEWKKSSPYNRFMNCSVCGFGQDHTTFKYCPNCGAKMDGDRREQNEG